MQMKYFYQDDSTVQFQPIAVKLKFDKARFQLQNLFNGDPTLGRVGNEAINQDPHVLLDEVKPAFEESLGKYFTDIANAAVAGASEQEILPPWNCVGEGEYRIWGDAIPNMLEKRINTIR